MRQPGAQTRLIFAGVFLLGVLVSTSYLQTTLHFSTYLALTVCFIDTIVSAMILLGHWK